MIDYHRREVAKYCAILIAILDDRCCIFVLGNIGKTDTADGLDKPESIAVGSTFCVEKLANDLDKKCEPVFPIML